MRLYRATQLRVESYRTNATRVVCRRFPRWRPQRSFVTDRLRAQLRGFKAHDCAVLHSVAAVLGHPASLTRNLYGYVVSGGRERAAGTGADVRATAQERLASGPNGRGPEPRWECNRDPVREKNESRRRMRKAA